MVVIAYFPLYIRHHPSFLFSAWPSVRLGTPFKVVYWNRTFQILPLSDTLLASAIDRAIYCNKLQSVA